MPRRTRKLLTRVSRALTAASDSDEMKRRMVIKSQVMGVMSGNDMRVDVRVVVVAPRVEVLEFVRCSVCEGWGWG